MDLIRRYALRIHSGHTVREARDAVNADPQAGKLARTAIRIDEPIFASGLVLFHQVQHASTVLIGGQTDINLCRKYPWILLVGRTFGFTTPDVMLAWIKQLVNSIVRDVHFQLIPFASGRVAKPLHLIYSTCARPKLHLVSSSIDVYLRVIEGLPFAKTVISIQRDGWPRPIPGAIVCPDWMEVPQLASRYGLVAKKTTNFTWREIWESVLVEAKLPTTLDHPEYMQGNVYVNRPLRLLLGLTAIVPLTTLYRTMCRLADLDLTPIDMGATTLHSAPDPSPDTHV